MEERQPVEETADRLAKAVDGIPETIRHNLRNNLNVIVNAIEAVPYCGPGCLNCQSASKGYVNDLVSGMEAVLSFFGGKSESCLHIDLEPSATVDALCKALAGSQDAKEMLLPHILIRSESPTVSFLQSTRSLKVTLLSGMALFRSPQGMYSEFAELGYSVSRKTADYVDTLGMQLIVLIYSGLLRDAMDSSSEAEHRNVGVA